MPWGAATPVEVAVALPWAAAGIVESLGGPYVAPPAPPGGVEVTPGDLTPGAVIPEATRYDQVHTLVVTDLRDGTVLAVDQVTLDLQDGSVFWTLSASGAGDLFAVLTEGEQPATVEVNIDGLLWRFIVEEVNRPRSFASDRVSFGGRSLAALAGSPFQFEVNWLSDAPTTAAQIAVGAQVHTDLAIDWQIEDWPIPAGVLSFAGTPLAVAQYVAQAVGAVVTAHRSDLSLTVQPRYPLLPNEWCSVPPDVAVAFTAVETESYVRADRPAYNAVLVSGQQQGAIGYVVLDGTSRSDMAPMVTDPLLTDVVALGQRGKSILGASGQQARVTRTLPVIAGVGVIERGALVRWDDPGDQWVGMVRSVNVQARLGFAQQTLGVERHTACLEGTFVPPDEGALFVFNGPIPDLEATVGEAFSADLSGYWADGAEPYTFSKRSGSLPPGLSLSAEGVISGTPTEVGGTTYQVRGQDAVSNTQDSNEFGVSVASAGAHLTAVSSTSPYGATSDDGITWTAFPSPGLALNSTPKRIPYGAGVFVFVNDFRIYSSADGFTWTERHFAGSGTYVDVVWTGTEFFAIKTSSTSPCARSADGITWTNTASPLPSAAIRTVAWHDSKFVVAENQGSTAFSTRIWTSPDGETWTLRHTEASWGCHHLVSDGTRVVAHPRILSSVGLSSLDGITWSTHATGDASTNYFAATWGGGLFVRVGTGRALRSSNGTTWSLAFTGIVGSASSVCWDGTQFIVVTSSSPQIATSPDGITWTLRTAPSQTWRGIGARV